MALHTKIKDIKYIILIYILKKKENKRIFPFLRAILNLDTPRYIYKAATGEEKKNMVSY